MKTQLLAYLDASAGYEFADVSSSLDISNQVSTASIRRKRDIISDQYQAGTCILRINDTSGNWNPQNSSSPYYDKVKPMAKIQIYARVSLGGSAYQDIQIWKGYIESSKYAYPKNQDIGYLDINASDALRILNTSAITTVTGATAGETAAVRWKKILDMISWPSALIDYNGDCLTPIAADTGTSRTVLGAINEVAFAEQGLTYCLRSGHMGLWSRQFLYNQQGTSAEGTFTNGTITNDTQFPYFDIRFSNIDNMIYNQAQVTRQGGTMQTYTDNASVTAYRLRNYYHDNSYNYTDADAYSVAASYTISRAKDILRAEVITVKMTQIETLYTLSPKNVLGIQVGSKVNIYNENIAGTSISLSQVVYSEAHDITPTEWTISYGTYKELTSGFILDSTTDGILDTSALGW